MPTWLKIVLVVLGLGLAALIGWKFFPQPPPATPPPPPPDDGQPETANSLGGELRGYGLLPVKPPNKYPLGTVVTLDANGNTSTVAPPDRAFSGVLTPPTPRVARTSYEAADTVQWDGKASVTLENAFYIGSAGASGRRDYALTVNTSIARTEYAELDRSTLMELVRTRLNDESVRSALRTLGVLVVTYSYDLHGLKLTFSLRNKQSAIAELKTSIVTAEGGAEGTVKMDAATTVERLQAGIRLLWVVAGTPAEIGTPDELEKFRQNVRAKAPKLALEVNTTRDTTVILAQPTVDQVALLQDLLQANREYWKAKAAGRELQQTNANLSQENRTLSRAKADAERTAASLRTQVDQIPDKVAEATAAMRQELAQTQTEVLGLKEERRGLSTRLGSISVFVAQRRGQADEQLRTVARMHREWFAGTTASDEPKNILKVAAEMLTVPGRFEAPLEERRTVLGAFRSAVEAALLRDLEAQLGGD